MEGRIKWWKENRILYSTMSLAIYKLKNVYWTGKSELYKNTSIFFVGDVVFQILSHLPFGYEDLEENMK